jgi:hypothetical protein
MKLKLPGSPRRGIFELHGKRHLYSLACTGPSGLSDTGGKPAGRQWRTSPDLAFRLLRQMHHETWSRRVDNGFPLRRSTALHERNLKIRGIVVYFRPCHRGAGFLFSE